MIRNSFHSLSLSFEISLSSLKTNLLAANWYKYHLRLVDPALSPCHDYCTSSISYSSTLTSTNGISFSSLLSLYPVRTGFLSVLMEVWLSPVIIRCDGISYLSSVLVSLACLSYFFDVISFTDLFDPCTSSMLSMNFWTWADCLCSFRYLARVCM
jgi:hypothetical protein